MLVLTRRKGERIVIDGRIVVTLVGVSAGSARIGIDAPKGVAVNREEIQIAIDRGDPRPGGGRESALGDQA